MKNQKMKEAISLLTMLENDLELNKEDSIHIDTVRVIKRILKEVMLEMYQSENDYSCKVIVQDKESGEIIDSKVFRQNNSGVVS